MNSVISLISSGEQRDGQKKLLPPSFVFASGYTAVEPAGSDSSNPNSEFELPKSCKGSETEWGVCCTPVLHGFRKAQCCSHGIWLFVLEAGQFGVMGVVDGKGSALIFLQPSLCSLNLLHEQHTQTLPSDQNCCSRKTEWDREKLLLWIQKPNLII